MANRRRPAKNHLKEPAVRDEVYKERRKKNNLAVQKSREKARNKVAETQTKVKEFTRLNCELEAKIDSYKSQLESYIEMADLQGFEIPGRAEIVALLREPTKQAEMPRVDFEENEPALADLRFHFN